MQKQQKRVFLILLLSLGLTNLQAQTSVNSAGGNASGGGGSASYSVGQMVYTTNSGANGSVAQGVQQPYEISVVIGIAEGADINLSASVHPNPTTEDIVLEIGNFTSLNAQTLSYQLFDVSGKLIKSEVITDNHTIINIMNLAAATYYVKVVQEKKELKTFKIIKN